jgi:hypothetical protein
VEYNQVNLYFISILCIQKGLVLFLCRNMSNVRNIIYFIITFFLKKKTDVTIYVIFIAHSLNN